MTQYKLTEPPNSKVTFPGGCTPRTKPGTKARGETPKPPEQKLGVKRYPQKVKSHPRITFHPSAQMGNRT